ncbi:MAG: hypothetical protein ACE5LU_16030, partial [Anaerolineae bacterium]
YAAREGQHVDCSSYEYALREAERELQQVMQQRARVEKAAAQYRRAAHRFLSMLQNELPRATGFLANRIAALEAYYSARVTAAAVALAAAGVAGVMGGVIAAIRRSRGELSRVMGSMGEQVAAQVLSERFGLKEVPFDQPKHGFDRVFRAPGMPLIVVESKVSSSGKLQPGQTQAGEQGSPTWIADKAARMADPSSAQWSPVNERIGQLVQELGPENVPTMAVVTNPTTQTVDVHVRQGDAGWQLLDSGITLDEFTARPSPGPVMPAEQKEGTWGGPEQKG